MKNNLFIHLTIMLFVFYPEWTAAQEYDTVAVRSLQVADNLFMVTGSGGNIAMLSGSEGVLLVDSQMKQTLERLSKKITELSDYPVKYLVTTHYHFDHIEGHSLFGEQGALIIAHEHCRERLAAGLEKYPFGTKQKPSESYGLPVITFSDTMTLYLNGEKIRLIHIPDAHTDGDVIVFFEKANVIHTGDLYVQYGVPYIDIKTGGSVDGFIRSCGEILALCNNSTVIIPGHGNVATPSDVLEFAGMVTIIRDRIVAGIDAGKSIDEILAGEPAREYAPERRADGLLRLYYESLSAR